MWTIAHAPSPCQIYNTKIRQCQIYYNTVLENPCASVPAAAHLPRGAPVAKNKALRNLHGGDADRLRYPSRGGRNPHHAAALSRRSLERAGRQPGDRRPRPQLLSALDAALRPARLAAGKRQAGQRSRHGAARRVRPARRQPRDLQRDLRRAGGVRSLYGRLLLQGDQRLDRGRMAVEGCKIARLDRGADAGAGSGGRGNRTPRLRPPLRLRAGAVAGRDAARTAASLAGVSGGREIQAADRDPCRQPVLGRAELDRLAVLSLRILSGRSTGVPGASLEPDL